MVQRDNGYAASVRRRDHDGPFQQGQLDGLCGIYSIVNALALLTAPGRPMSLSTASKLYRQGIAFVGTHTTLDYACGFGLEGPLWLQLTRHLADARSHDAGAAVIVTRPFANQPNIGFSDMLKVMETALGAGAVLLASLGGMHNHYTVIDGYDAHRLRLFDSCGLRWVMKAACGSGRSWRRHQIGSPWLQILSVGRAT